VILNWVAVANKSAAKFLIYWVFITTVKLGYNELAYNEHSVITNKYLGKIGHFSAQMNPAKMKPGYNEQK
jgi:hypothetical protein